MLCDKVASINKPSSILGKMDFCIYLCTYVVIFLESRLWYKIIFIKYYNHHRARRMAVRAKVPSSCVEGWGSIPRAGTPPLYQKCQKSVGRGTGVLCNPMLLGCWLRPAGGQKFHPQLRGWWHDLYPIIVISGIVVGEITCKRRPDLCATISNVQWWMWGTIMESGECRNHLQGVVPDQPVCWETQINYNLLFVQIRILPTLSDQCASSLLHVYLQGGLCWHPRSS